MITKLLVGLGNPGPQYTHTRHNLGFMVVDELARRHGATWKHESKLKAEVTQIEINSESMLLAKPQTFMNLSGESVQRLMQFYKIPLHDLWVITDDLDTPFGRARVRVGGSSGGHNGLASIIEAIGSNFHRLRLGIGQNHRATEPAEAYVLHPFTPVEQPHLPTLTTAAANLLESALAVAQPQPATHQLIEPEE